MVVSLNSRIESNKEEEEEADLDAGWHVEREVQKPLDGSRRVAAAQAAHLTQFAETVRFDAFNGNGY